MCKGVGNLHHYQSQALACNQRYLEALAPVADPTPSYDDLKQLTERQRDHGRSYAGFNPARKDEARLFAAVLETRPIQALVLAFSSSILHPSSFWRRS